MGVARKKSAISFLDFPWNKPSSDKGVASSIWTSPRRTKASWVGQGYGHGAHRHPVPVWPHGPMGDGWVNWCRISVWFREQALWIGSVRDIHLKCLRQIGKYGKGRILQILMQRVGCVSKILMYIYILLSLLSSLLLLNYCYHYNYYYQ